MTHARTTFSTTLCMTSVVLSALLLSACGTKILSITDDLIVVRATERNRTEALELAESSCQQRGLRARLTRRIAENQLGFECVR